MRPEEKRPIGTAEFDKIRRFRYGRCAGPKGEARKALLHIGGWLTVITPGKYQMGEVVADGKRFSEGYLSFRCVFGHCRYDFAPHCPPKAC